MFKVRHSAWAVLAAVGLLVSCTPDPEPGGADGPTSTTAADPGPSTETTVNEPRIADDCPPESGAPQVPTAWPEALTTTVGVDGRSEAIDIDLTTAIDATCFVLAPTYAAAFDIPIPQFGELSTSGATLTYEPVGPPADLDHPADPWWGEDRVRVCVELEGGRQGCTNIDIQVLRADVAALQDRFEVTTHPQLTTPPQRSGGDTEVTSGGVARLQDAFAAEWALQLVAQTLDLPEVPLALSAACEASGASVDDLVAAGQGLLDEHAELLDTSAVAIITTMGDEPDAELSARANAALAAVEAWVACEI